MNNEAPTALILGGTGRSGSLLADLLAQRGITPVPRHAAERTSASTGTTRPPMRPPWPVSTASIW
ncbi:hypothetical protein [Nocardia sp. CA-120079]|uniref:hypothetical protein n=1 Tax=Nocardia sp. CA-120079 TaxID=3239974 RepID=UPI003D958A85